MHSIHQTLDALELACEGDEELVGFNAPDISQIIETIKTLPADERVAIQDRLDRVSTIIEGKMMMYAEEMEKLGGQIRNVANSNAATNAYRTVAVFPIKNEGTDNS